jgi:hypothetical protein
MIEGWLLHKQYINSNDKKLVITDICWEREVLKLCNTSLNCVKYSVKTFRLNCHKLSGFIRVGTSTN